MSTSTHAAVVTVAPGAKLELRQVPTPKPEGNEIKVRQLWTCSTPFDLHQNDGHLGVTPPQILGGGFAGTVVEVGPAAKQVKVGDQVFGFGWRNAKEAAYQEFVVIPENLAGVVPTKADGSTWPLQEAVTLPDNLITAYNTLVHNYNIDLPWPKPDDYVPRDADASFLIWGGGSSTGMYMLQVLKWLGYRNVIALASRKHHDLLQGYGAFACFDYRDADVIDQINRWQDRQGHDIRYFYDCIGSVEGSINGVSKLARRGSTVAVLLPVVIRDAAEGVLPEYAMDVAAYAEWAPGVDLQGVRTHLYLNSPLLAAKGQPEMMPEALRHGVVEPNQQMIVEGSTLLERAEKAMGMLRNKVASGQRLVWRIAEVD